MPRFAGSKGALGTALSRRERRGGPARWRGAGPYRTDGAHRSHRRGPTGATGSTGPAGPTGPQGATGAAGQPDYAYIYNTGAETVAVESDVTFSTTGPVSGFTHVPAASTIGVETTGTYLVKFSVTGTQAGQFTLMDNGDVVAGTTYGTGNRALGKMAARRS